MSNAPVNVLAVAEDFFFIAGPVIGFCVVIGLAIYIVTRLSSRAPSATQIGIVAASSVLGGALGAIAGTSTEPLIGGLVTGVIGIATALLSVAFARETDAPLKAALPIAIIALLLNSIAGLSTGRNWRQRWDLYASESEHFKARRDQVLIPVTREYRAIVIRKCLNAFPDYQEAAARCAPTVLFPQ